MQKKEHQDQEAFRQETPDLPDSQDETSSPEEETMTQQLEEQKNQYLRLAAEYDNFRKRTLREREGLFADARAMTLTAFLPLMDNFERAMESEGEEDDFRKGMGMIFTQMQEVLASMDVVSFGETGEEFDPQIHHAVMQSEEEGTQENTVTQVLQKGYKMGDRLLRPAMVAVAQ